MVEDDTSIRELVCYTLNHTGFEVKGFSCAADFFGELKSTMPELVLLDIMLPNEDGLSILKRLREDTKTQSLPVIMLTAKGTEYDRVMGLDNGADDYISKPFGMMELVSRIKAVLRRVLKEVAPYQYSYKGLALDENAHHVLADGVSVDLTLKEFNVLQLLLQNQGRVMTRDNLLQQIWGYDFDGETRTVDVHIRTLRMKLGAYGDAIETVRGIGYRIGGAQ